MEYPGEFWIYCILSENTPGSFWISFEIFFFLRIRGSYLCRIRLKLEVNQILQDLLFSEEPIPAVYNYLKDSPSRAVSFSFSSWQQSVVGLLFLFSFFLTPYVDTPCFGFKPQRSRWKTLVHTRQM